MFSNVLFRTEVIRYLRSIMDGEDFIEFDSLINIRPRQNNFSRDVEDVQIQKAIIDITNKYILR